MRIANKHLRRHFLELNKKFFRNKLDKDTVVKYGSVRTPTGEKGLGVAFFRRVTRKPTSKDIKEWRAAARRDRGDKLVAVSDYRPHITISKDIQNSGAQSMMTLLHEMAHVKYPNRHGHGYKFNREMLRLAKAGAFNGWW